MTDPNQPPHPLGADAPHEDFVGLAFAALRFAIAAGVGLNALVTLAVRTLQANRPASAAIDLGGAPALTLLGGTFLACLFAAIVTWKLMAPARSPYRQGMLAMVSFFASFVGSMVAWPIDRAWGRLGLVGLAALAALVAALGWRSVRRAIPVR